MVAGVAATEKGDLRAGAGEAHSPAPHGSDVTWLLFARAPPPDAPYWPGRRWWAVLDALAWPAAWIAAITHVPLNTGLAGKVFVALAALGAARRLHRAAWSNHCYRFTTWRWGRVLGMLLLLGWALKLTLGAR